MHKSSSPALYFVQFQEKQSIYRLSEIVHVTMISMGKKSIKTLFELKTAVFETYLMNVLNFLNIFHA